MKIDNSSKQHAKLLGLIRPMIESGRSVITQRTNSWNRAETNKKAYVDLTAKDRNRADIDTRPGPKGEKRAGYKGAAPIVVPITFAMNMTTLSYMMSIFGSRNPSIPIAPGGGIDDVRSSIQMEAVLNYQTSEMQYFMKLYLWLQDMIDYGIGVTYNYWKTKTHPIVKDANATGLMGLARQIGVPVPVRKVVEEVIGYEGNDVTVIDPYNLIPDIRAPFRDINKGEFFGFDVNITKVELLSLSNSYNLYNLDKISKNTTSTNTFSTNSNNSFRDKAIDVSTTQSPGGMGEHKLSRMFVKLIPSEYELSEYRGIQVYEFWVIDDSIIVYAEVKKSYGLDFPFSVIEYCPDAHSLFSQGQSELLEGLQSHLSWLFNSHMDNVRKALNDMFIVDPSRINVEDLKDPAPGKLIRLKETAYGQDISSMIHQFNVVDVTAGHMNKASAVIDLMQRVSAANDNMMGMPNFGRRTATEVENTNIMAGGRMRMLAELAHSQGIKGQHEQFIMNTQQFLSQDRMYRITGDAVGMNRTVMVRPEDILGRFDIPPADGTMPTDKMQLISVWKEMFSTIGQNQILLASGRYNMVGIFEHIARLMGAKDVDKFINQQDPNNPQLPQVPGIMDDEMLEENVRKGDMVPISQILGDQAA